MQPQTVLKINLAPPPFYDLQNPQGDLFVAVPDVPEPEEHSVLGALRGALPDDLSPKAALEKLYALNPHIS